jgi:transcriptional regulator with XRE-family HTH domain
VGAEELSNRLNQALQKRGIRKMYALAVDLGVDESAISRWRRGGPISLTHVVDLCRYLDVSLDWLLMGRGTLDMHKDVYAKYSEHRLFRACVDTTENAPAHVVDALLVLLEYFAESEPNKKSFFRSPQED